MSLTVLEVLEGLNTRIAELSEIHSSLNQRIKELEEENRSLKKELEEYEEQNNRQSRDIEYLKISHKLAASPDNILQARRHIARLIRTIDSCITMIKEE